MTVAKELPPCSRALNLKPAGMQLSGIAKSLNGKDKAYAGLRLQVPELQEKVYAHHDRV
jgi:hypothetical protein